ncbi:hypothetical protein SAMN05216223_112150 [Actinacidiphila yanglinensis]|uniref:Knr4/Smi1-like domain-containing protein n=2 Tax=Actinacidiphila yanglinensis TaxID=310779 RepID=A0A1H6D7I4_9ACTN|nr:hypothetical protein SAMN05216223_112150 [Actinacidiphila yanglinensis]
MRCASLAAMELTQAALDDLLAHLGPGDAPVYLPGEVGRHELTELLAGRYGAPRTLVLNGATDPTVDDSKGAALLAPFAGRAVTIRAWADGARWIGAGSALDGEGVERAVLTATPRALPEVLAVAPGQAPEDVDWMARLVRVTGWERPERRPDPDWAEIETRLGTPLPDDYKRMVGTFGRGAFDGWLDLNAEPWTSLREDGLLIWASTEHEDLYGWRLDGDDPDRWPVVVRSFDNVDTSFPYGAAAFVCRVLVDPHHRYSMARFSETHWFAGEEVED